MSKKFTNATTPRTVAPDYLVRTRERVRPYISSGYASALTPKEKAARQQSRTASFGGSSGGYGGGNTALSQHGAFFSPPLSTDFLELPQSLREKREIYRHFYNSDELVGQAIDLHTELPLSKVRLAPPKPRTAPEGFPSPENYGKYILSRFKAMNDKIKLFQRLITILHHYWLDGAVAIFAEDSVVEMPEDFGYDKVSFIRSVLTADGEAVEVADEQLRPRPTKDEEELAYYAKHYQGWAKLIVLPVDRVKITTYSFSDTPRLELIPTNRDRELVLQAKQGDVVAEEMLRDMPPEVRDHIENERFIPLGSDPDEGSFAYLLQACKSADVEQGDSILSRCLRTLYFRDKLRQAQTSIASRAMTPKRLVWAEGLSDADVDALREQVDLALVDPDFSIVTNYEIHWEEMGARDRLLDLSSEYEQTERRLLSGLGVTEALMSGESLFSGDRLKLEVINNRYIHVREVLQEYVEENLFKPVARRMGFVEKDEWGQEVVLYPRLSFTRLPLRDSQDYFDAIFNMYQKGSVSVDLVLEALNIDPSDTKAKIEQDVFTVNDATFNEIMRSVYSEVGRMLAEKTDVADKVASYLNLKMKPEDNGGESGGRF